MRNVLQNQTAAMVEHDPAPNEEGRSRGENRDNWPDFSKGGGGIRTHEFILRFWQRHKVKGVCYPSKRSFVVPVDKAEEIAEAIQLAARGVAGEKRTWLTEREAAEDEELVRMADVGVSADTIERDQERLERYRRERI